MTTTHKTVDLTTLARQVAEVWWEPCRDHAPTVKDCCDGSGRFYPLRLPCQSLQMPSHMATPHQATGLRCFRCGDTGWEPEMELEKLQAAVLGMGAALQWTYLAGDKTYWVSVGGADYEAGSCQVEALLQAMLKVPEVQR